MAAPALKIVGAGVWGWGGGGGGVRGLQDKSVFNTNASYIRET